MKNERSQDIGKWKVRSFKGKEELVEEIINQKLEIQGITETKGKEKKLREFD